MALRICFPVYELVAFCLKEWIKLSIFEKKFFILYKKIKQFIKKKQLNSKFKSTLKKKNNLTIEKIILFCWKYCLQAKGYISKFLN